MANFVQRFLDDFTNSTVDMQTDLGNGSISEPAGTTLDIDCPISVNCEWFTSPSLNSPVAYEEIADHIEGPPTTIRVETRMTGVVRSGTQIIPGIVIWQDRSNAYRMGWSAAPNTIHLNQTIAGVGADIIGSAGGRADPSVTPHVYRIYWNGGSESAIIEEGRDLNPGEVSFYWSDDDGITFNHLDTRTLPFSALRVGIYSYNYSSLPSCDADFDYFSIEQDVQTADTTIVKDAEIAGVSDEFDFLDQGGPLRHTFPDTGAGQLVPGPIDQEISSVGPFDAASADDYETFPTPGGPTRHTYPDVGAGQLVPGPADQNIASVGPFDAAGVTDESQFLGAGGSTERGVLVPGPPDQLPETPVGGPADAASPTDDSTLYLSTPPDFRTDTADSYASAHFTSLRPFFAVFHETSGIWTTPTNPSFNGFGRDGYEYINGVQQVTQAPWATEASSADRSPRFDFPRKVLITVALSELVIYDLDNYPTDLSVWMRFLYNAGFSLIGTSDRQIASVAFSNGTLIVGTTQGSFLGRLHLIDFKSTGQDFFHLIGSDDHWVGVAGRDITDRNTSGNNTTSLEGRPELRIQNEYCYSVDGYDEGNNVWVAVGGEDGIDVIEIQNSVPQFDYVATGPDIGSADIGDSRNVVFDFVGWMWWSVEDRLFRALFDYQSGVISADSTSIIQKSVQLPDNITSLVSLGSFVYAGTDSGVYQIDRGTMEFHLAYTTSGGGGRGKGDVAGTGEKVAGDNPVVGGLSGFSEKNSDYVEVATGVPATGVGAVTVIRNFDDVVIRSRKFTAASDGYTATAPGLLEGGAFFNRSFRIT